MKPHSPTLEALAVSRCLPLPTGRLSEKLIARIEAIQRAMNHLSDDDLGGIPCMAGAVATLKEAAETFIGWHQHIDNPIDVTFKPGAIDGEIEVTFGDAKTSRFYLNGTRWRGAHGPAVSEVEVACAIGQPIAFLDGLLLALRGIQEAQMNRREPYRVTPVFVALNDAARIIGVPAARVSEWVSAKIIPFYEMPGISEPWFKVAELKKWAGEFSQRHGGLDSSPRIELVVRPSEPAKFFDVPECLRHISGLRQASLLDSCCGVYFLCRQGQVVYVGQSVDVLSRVGQHRIDKTKTFDTAFFVPCRQCDLNTLERELIDRLMPEYNADPATRAKRRAVPA